MIQQITAGIRSAKGAFDDELRSNPRLIKMGWVIGYILCGYIIFGLSDFNDSLGEKSEAMQAEIARIMRGAETSEQSWQSRLNDEKKSQVQIVGRCWMAADSRLASADMQTELQRLYREYDLKNTRLTLSDPESTVVDAGKVVWIIRGEVKGKIGLPRLPALINALENAENRFFVRELQYTKQKKTGSLSLTLAACFTPGKSYE